MNLENEKKEKTSEKRKTIIKRLIITLVITLIITGLVYGIISVVNYLGNKTNGINDLNNILEEYKTKTSYSVTTTSLKNQMGEYYAKLNNSAYILPEIDNKKEYEYLIKDGDTYFIKNEEKEYYKYKNNVIELKKFINEIKEFKDLEYVEGKENIENKRYEYQEYAGTTYWVYDNEIDRFEENAKTKFYFNDGKLEYIKTIQGEKEELVKIDISDDISKANFELPQGYEEK